MSNNPPDVILELTMAEAKFMLDNCNSNITFGLNALQRGELSQAGCEQLIAIMEQFKTIRVKLLTGGVSND